LTLPSNLDWIVSQVNRPQVDAVGSVSVLGAGLLIDPQPPLQDRKRKHRSEKDSISPGASKGAGGVARAPSQERRMGFLEGARNDPGIVNLPELPVVREPLFRPSAPQDLERLLKAGS